MATQITSDNFEDYFLRTQEKYSDSLEQAEGARGASVVTDLDSMKRTLVIPGVRYDVDPVEHENASAEEYVQIPYSVLSDQLDDMASATEAAQEAAAGVTEAIETAAGDHERAENDHARADGDHTTAQGDHTRAEGDHTRAETDHVTAAADHATASSDHSRSEGDHATATGDHTTAAGDHTTAQGDHTRAEGDHTRADGDHQAVQGAENLDAQLSGMTVTITNRQGVSTSVDIGFDIYRTYASRSAMNADAANVPDGKFVMIATADPTDPDNATLWARTSDAATSPSPFRFLSDLDQASSAAWADWLENMKPVIEGKITQAEADHGIASQDHTTAVTDHSVASGDHTRADGDHTQAVSDHTTASSDHTTSVSDHTLAVSDHTQAAQDHGTAGADHIQSQADHTRAEGDHTTADSDHTQATGDHATAASDHTRAEGDHTTAASDHTQAAGDHEESVEATENANTQADRAKGWADHPPYIADGTEPHPGDLNYWYLWDESTSGYVKGPYAKGDDLHWDEMSEQEKEELARRVVESLTFASDETCESIIDELT